MQIMKMVCYIELSVQKKNKNLTPGHAIQMRFVDTNGVSMMTALSVVHILQDNTISD